MLILIKRNQCTCSETEVHLIIYTTLSFFCLLCELLIQSCGPFVKGFNVFNGAHGLVVIGVWTVTYIRQVAGPNLARAVVTLDVLCCVLRQGSLTALFQPPPHTQTAAMCPPCGG